MHQALSSTNQLIYVIVIIKNYRLKTLFANFSVHFTQTRHKMMKSLNYKDKMKKKNKFYKKKN